VKRTAAVIGGAGGMGQWLIKFFQRRGFEVVIADIEDTKARQIARKLHVKFAESNEKAVKQCNIVAIATPPRTIASVIQKVAPEMPKGSTLFDVGSIKRFYIDVLKSISKLGIRVASAHPMFGPSTPTAKGRKIIMVRVNARFDATTQVAALFRSEGARVHITDVQTHDRYMRLVLGLPHTLAILFANTLHDSRETLSDLKSFSGTTFDLMLLLAENVAQSGTQAEMDLYVADRKNERMLRLLLKNLQDLLESARRRDEASLRRILSRSVSYLTTDMEFASSRVRFNQAFEAILPKPRVY